MTGARRPKSRAAVAAKASPVPRDGVAKTSGASAKLKQREGFSFSRRAREGGEAEVVVRTAVEDSICWKDEEINDQ